MPKLTEEDVKNRYITPSIEQSGWQKKQMWMEYFFTDGKVIIKGKKAKRGTRKKLIIFYIIITIFQLLL